MSAARAYLHPVSKRPNLTITRAFVSKILFEGIKPLALNAQLMGKPKNLW